MNELKYPIGLYEPQLFSETQKNKWIIDVAQLPQQLEASLLNLDEAQLHTPYRPGGWTVQQLVHHIADSHINAFCRMKCTLTEDKPTIKAYEENLWAQQADVDLPVNISTTILHALHLRMVTLLKAVQPAEWDRTYIHPETGKENTLWYLLGMYAWHGRHHVAHIQALRQREGWQ